VLSIAYLASLPFSWVSFERRLKADAEKAAAAEIRKGGNGAAADA